MNQRAAKWNSIIKLGVFLFNPLLGFIVSLRQIKSNSSYIIFFLFSFIFGISFVVPLDRRTGYSGDGVVYRQKFERIAEYKTTDFNYLLNDYLEFDEGDKDFYVIAASFLVSRFTNNYHWMFGVYAIVFSFFMLKSLRFLTDEKNFTNSFFCFLLATMFIMSNPIFNINGVRFWTAAWIGVYSLFQIFRNGNTKFLLLACLTPFIHVSFFVYLFVVVLGLFFRQFNKFWFVLFCISFFVSEASIYLLESVESYLPGFISRTVALYTDPEIMAMKAETKVWYADFIILFPRLIVNLMIVFIYKNRALISSDSKSYNLFLFLLVWATFVNFTMLVPSLGGRFFQLSIPMIAYIWLTTFINQKYSKWILAYFIAFAATYLYTLQLIFKVTEIEFYVGNLFYVVYYYL